MNDNLSRRRFLAAAGAGALVALHGRAPRAAEPRQAAPRGDVMMGLGFSLYGMKAIPTLRALRLCAEIGYDSVELALMPGWTDSLTISPRELELIRKALDGERLALPSLMDNIHLPVDEATHRVNLDRIRAAAQVAHSIRPDAPPLLETVCGGKPAQWDELKTQMADRLGDWAQAAEAAELIVAIKPHVGGAMHLPEHAVWLIQQVNSPAIKAVYDYSHYQPRGLSLAGTIDQLIDQTVFVHVKDTAGDADKPRFLLPGDGTTDYVEYLRLLGDKGYGGHVVVEVSGMISNVAGYDAERAARHCYAKLAPAFERAGVDRPQRSRT